MNNFNSILEKLEGFLKRYYTNELLKSLILFFTIGFLYFLFTLFVEHVLWLNTTARSILFWLFVFVESALLVKFIFMPLAKLFKLQKGLSYEQASKIIGKHFPQVNDKLVNVLQLHQNHFKSELLLASIEQKALELNPIPFKRAINLKKNTQYLKYAAIPVSILLVTFLTGNSSWYGSSYERVVNYKTAYQPPAPFTFYVLNDHLNAIENTDFKIVVVTTGELIPEQVQIRYNNEIYFLQQIGVGEFEYLFSKPKESFTFQLLANQIISKPYTVNVAETPIILGFEMALDYPSYTNKKDAVLKSSGNAIVPEGTRVTWRMQTKSTDAVYLYSKDTLSFNFTGQAVFKASKSIYNNLHYTISTSNKTLNNYENLEFQIQVVKDQYPEITLQVEQDTTDLQTLYFYGLLNDDYGISKLQLVYSPLDNELEKTVENIPISNSNVAEFITAFPNNLQVKPGVPYELYFQVFDNDAVNKFKSVKSQVFMYRKRTKEEEENKQLEQQNKAIKDLNKSLDKFSEQEKSLEELTKTQKEKNTLNFNDQKKLEAFFKRQKQQDEMIKNFNKKLKDNLEDFQIDYNKDNLFKEDLKQRLQENEEKLLQDEKILEELKMLQDKINKEELTPKLEELAKQNKNKKRSLEQLLELTKRFYVEKKLENLMDDLMNLSKEQETLSNESETDTNNTTKQDALNKQFQDFKNDIEALQKESKTLKKPIDIPRDKLDETEIENEQQDAFKELNKQEENQSEGNQNIKNAQKNQKKAAQKMKQMSQKMQQQAQSSNMEQIQEDVEMLRQILDNLVLFSFDQEIVMNQFSDIQDNNNKYANYLKKQHSLREHFLHIDDSLFALSLRNPKLTERVNNEITEVYYNIDKALDFLSQSQVYQGVSNQQFTITAANNLADFLSNVLDNMQASLSMALGKGGEGDMQLPDIIMSQEQLNKKMHDGLKKNNLGDNKDGKEDGKQQDDSTKNKPQQGGKQNDNNQKPGEGEGTNDDINGLLYDIYQQQQQLRNALESKLKKEGISNNANALVKSMEEIELDLLNKGFTQQTFQKMLQLKHQLLKLDNAVFQQGIDDKRQSKTNKDNFNNHSNYLIPKAKEYFNTTEILNKQALPLQPAYKNKVQAYFKITDD